MVHPTATTPNGLEAIMYFCFEAQEYKASTDADGIIKLLIVF